MTNKPMLRVVGLGPGDTALLTPQAFAALEQAEVLVGYGPYIDLVPDALKAGRELITTGMTGEMARCKAALEHAVSGSNTVVVSSGDPGVYGMAGLVLELAHEMQADVEIEIVAGVPAACAGAALLGAPLMHDFAVISLSDLLTPWEKIEQRLDLSAQADFVQVIYNPRSRRRDWQLKRALEIVRMHRPAETVVGLVRNAYRPDQLVKVTTLGLVDIHEVDMLTILFVGNESTRELGGNMVTPRGYLGKYNVQK